jgi:hypothetical protein
VTKLSAAQIASYAAGAGFTGQGLVDAVAVALAESGGNTEATHTNSDTYRSVDRGLWQINSHWHPEVSAAQAFDPAQAAAAAYRISGGGRSWSPWSTWTNGAAAVHIPTATMAAHQAKPTGATANDAGLHVPIIPGMPLIPGVPGLGGLDLTDPLGSITDSLKHAKTTVDVSKQALVFLAHGAEWIANPHNWVRVGFVVGGGAALLMGAYMLADSGAAGSIAQSAAGTAKETAKSAAAAAALA